MSSAESESGSEERSGSESVTPLDADSAALVDTAPLHARIGEALQQCVSSVPAEVETLLSAKGAKLASSRHLKTSFHATFFGELDPPLIDSGVRFSRVIIQVLGAQLGAKALFRRTHISAATLTRACELASRAGVRVPKILAVGQCATEIGLLDFAVEEFIETQTVEDEVSAPQDQGFRIAAEIKTKLCAYLPTMEESEPLPRFDSVLLQLQWLLELVPLWDVELRGAIANFTDDFLMERSAVCPPVLLHQDLNNGNVLCSEVNADENIWALDAVIDWESAAIADPFSLSDEDPWRAVRQFALLAKGSALADWYCRRTLPRCELSELVQCYDEVAHEMDTARVLKYKSWAARVKLAQDALMGELNSAWTSVKS